MSEKENLSKILRLAYRLTVLTLALVVFMGVIIVYSTYDPQFTAFRSKPEEVEQTAIIDDENKIENGIHIRTGLVDAEGLMTVVNNCTNCHSAKLIMQNRMNAERWNATIRWMQETQNLWDLGTNQEVIVNYLVTNYPPKKKGRRENLSNIEWYELED